MKQKANLDKAFALAAEISHFSPQIPHPTTAEELLLLGFWEWAVQIAQQREDKERDREIVGNKMQCKKR